MNTEAILDAVKASLERVVPGALALFLATMLALAIGVTWLVEGPALIRSITFGLTQPFRSLVLLICLGLPLVVLCCITRLLMGYNVSRWSRHHRKRQ